MLPAEFERDTYDAPKRKLDVLLYQIATQIRTIEQDSSERNSHATNSVGRTIYDEDKSYLLALHELSALFLEILHSGSYGTSIPAALYDHAWKIPIYAVPDFAILSSSQMMSQSQALARARASESSPESQTTHFIWADQKLHHWASSEKSSMIMVQGNSQSRELLGAFGLEIVDFTVKKHPTLFLLYGPATCRHLQESDAVEMLSQILVQGLQQASPPQSAMFVATILELVAQSSTVEDLCCVLEYIASVCYPALFIVLDLCTLNSQSTQSVAEVLTELAKLVQRLQSTQSTCLKVLFTTHRRLPPEIDNLMPKILVSHRELTLSSQISRRLQARHDLSLYSPVKREPPPGTQTEEAAIKNQGTDLHSITQMEATWDRAVNADKLEGQRKGFDVAVFCALPLEASAVVALFDESLDMNLIGKRAGDWNTYSAGIICGRKVVVVHMPGMGKGKASVAAMGCRVSFPEIRLALIVGICGGVPFTSNSTEIVLGDVVISNSLIPYDFGRQFPDAFKRKATHEDNARKQPLEVAAFIAKLKSEPASTNLYVQTSLHLHEVYRASSLREWARYPGVEQDILYEPTYHHQHHTANTCSGCDSSDADDLLICEAARKSDCEALGCDSRKRVTRKRHAVMAMNVQEGRHPMPVIHIGAIASGDKVMKSGNDRDQTAREEDIIAFEMEGIGVWEIFPSIIVKGVCDYADSHKNKDWQKYAAVTAAACTKALLEAWILTHT